MDVVIQSSLFLGIIPALILLYISLKDWHGHYKEKILFILFIVGIITGFLIAIIQLSIVYDALVLFIMFPFFEQMVKALILNLRKIKAKQATVIYGLSLGLGFGSIYPPASLILLADTDIPLFGMVSILLGSLGLVFLHGVTGTLIGYGIYKGKLLMFYGYSVILLIAANFLKLEYVQWLNLVIGIVMFYYVHKNIVKKTVDSFDKKSLEAKE